MEGFDTTRLVRGTARYAADLAMDGAAWISVLRSDLPHGRIEGIDVAEAMRAEGVLAVLTAADLPEVPRIPIRVGSTASLEAQLQPVLAVERVRYVGEPLAVVVGESPAAVEHAMPLVFADITPLESKGNAASPATVWEDLEHDVFVDLTAGDGDTTAALAQAETIVTLEMTTARKTGLPLEPRGLIAQWDGDLLDIWGATKFLHFTRRTLATMFDIPAEAVRCHRTDIGGMFGVRGEFYPEDFLVPWASRLIGRPVRWEEGRREHLMAINHAGEQRHDIRVGLDGEGRPMALEADVVVEVGAYPRPIGSRIAHIVVETLPGPYAWDAFLVRCRTVATHRTPTGTVRGPAAFETTFARERALDVAARRAGLDPLLVRRRGLITADALPYRRGLAEAENRVVFDSGDFPAVLDGLLDRCGFSAWRRERDRRRLAGESVGVGLGSWVIHSALGGEETVEVDLTTEGGFLVRTSATEVGQGLDRMAAAVLAARLGIQADQVEVWSGDTAAHAEGGGTFSSRSTVFVANALLDAARLLSQEIVARAAELLAVAPADIALTPNGPTSNTKALHWKEVAPLTVSGRFRMDHPTYGFGAHAAMVSVDLETGVVTPERMAVGYDCGRALDPAAVASQLRGGVAAGIGASLYEQLVFDPDGFPMTLSLADYLVPTAETVPSIDIHVFESAPAPGNPLGIKGVGEAGVIGVGAAIANAVADALDAHGDLVRALPIDREAIALGIVAGAK